MKQERFYMSKNFLKQIVNILTELGGKSKNGKTINFVKPKLSIKNKKTGVKYTVIKVDLEDKENPTAEIFRYDPSGKGKMFLTLNKDDFDDYEPT